MAKFLTHILFPTIAISLYLGQAYWRYDSESGSYLRGGKRDQIIGAKWDPRGFDRVMEIRKSREVEAFRYALVHKSGKRFVWPGLRSLQLTYSWLELLQANHTESSYEKDFSYLFSHLHFLSQHGLDGHGRFVLAFIPFFYVMGKDDVGANIMLNETLLKYPDRWKSWFWGGFHSLENNGDRQLAGNLYSIAGKIDGSPLYLASLSLKLQYGEDIFESSEGRAFLKRTLDPEILEKIKYRLEKKE